MKMFLRAAVAGMAILPFILTGCGREAAAFEIQSDSTDSIVTDSVSETLNSEASIPAGSDSTDSTADSGSSGKLSEKNGAESVLPAVTAEPLPICVYVCGAVKTPGVYRLPEESRVCDAIAAAGGLLEDAEERSLNQAERLVDGEQITVFTKEEITANGGRLSSGGAITGGASGSAEGSAAGGVTNGTGADGTTARININTASREQLMMLPGIGKARAAAIIAYREENGAFSSIEAIQNVEGIKEKAFNKIKDLIEV